MLDKRKHDMPSYYYYYYYNRAPYPVMVRYVYTHSMVGFRHFPLLLGVLDSTKDSLNFL